MGAGGVSGLSVSDELPEESVVALSDCVWHSLGTATEQRSSRFQCHC